MNEKMLIEAAQREGVLPLEDAAGLTADSPSWIITTLSFVGAQLVAAFLLGSLGTMSADFFLRAPGALVGAAVLIGGAVWLMRVQPGMFVMQLAFSGLMAGLALLMLGMRWDWGNRSLLVMVAVLLSVAIATRVGWVQAVLGFLAASLALLMNWRTGWDIDFGSMLRFFPVPLNMALLAVVWAAWVVHESRAVWRAPWSALHAVMGGVGGALLVAAGLAGRRYFSGWSMFSARGSADDPTAGLAALFSFQWPVLLQMALVLGAAVWLFRHWRLQRAARRDGMLLALVYAVLWLACFVIPQVGVVALVGTVALGTGRRGLLGLALAVLLAGLSGFYYALAWPLVHKAALLAATGAGLGVALWAMRGQTKDAASSAAQRVAERGSAVMGWMAPFLVGVGAVAALASVHVDVQNKERIIAHGQKIYVPLVPRDPRSLMQGDYMALNFDFPRELQIALRAGNGHGLSRYAKVVAVLDERGVASVKRLATSNESLAAGEMLLPIKRLKRDWGLVTDAFYFPEGQGRPFTQAQFGEFRVLPDGRALLVGLADEHLQAIAPMSTPMPMPAPVPRTSSSE
ncbi:GDYXXLXY domain-containing protein [Ottowia sp.]|uniref:GDYXXLXY domain-containing protein n=1 Tax=Ottowia sp. TaxID=1898956 RepID=UPI003A8C4507